MRKPKNSKSQGKDSDYVLVYSSDPKPEETCANCRRPISACVCAVNAISLLRPAVRLERKGRGGKNVTIIYKLPANEALLNKLLAYLKKSLGSGGTCYMKDGQGLIEIQGEQGDRVLKLIADYK